MPYYRCPSCGLTSYSAAAHASVRVCPTCAAGLTETSRLYLVPGSKHDVSCTLRVRPEAAPQARHAVAGLALSETTRENLALVVTELVTNVVRHAGLSPSDTFSMDLTNSDTGVRLAVHDGGCGFAPDANEPDDLFETHGRGLVIVAALSDAWGVESDADGCTVWCDMPAIWPAEPDTAALLSRDADVFTASAAGLPA